MSSEYERYVEARRQLATAVADGARQLVVFILQHPEHLQSFVEGRDLASVIVLIRPGEDAQATDWELEVRLADPAAPPSEAKKVMHLRGKLQADSSPGDGQRLH